MKKEIPCWNCGAAMPLKEAQWVYQSNAAGRPKKINAASCKTCVDRTNAALMEDFS